MSKAKRVLKSVGAAIVALGSGFSVVGGISYLLTRLSEKALVITLLSFVVLAGLFGLSLIFYAALEAEPRPTIVSDARRET